MVDRVFELLEEVVSADVLDDRQLSRLLAVIDRAVADPAATDPGALAELVAILEELVADPEDLAETDVDGVLAVLERAVAGDAAEEAAHLEDVFSVLREVVADPAGVDPDDVERFTSGLEGALADVTDPHRGLGRLFPLFGLAGVDLEDVEDVDVDVDSNLEEEDLEDWDLAAEGGEELVDLFRIARIATGLTQRATGNSLETGIRTGTRMAYAAANADSPVDLLADTRAIALDELQRAGVDIGDEQAAWLRDRAEDVPMRRPVTAEALRERGERLLSQSAEVGRDESLHPAYPSVLDQLAADEARILRLLATEGTAATLTVRDRRWLPFRSRLVAANLTTLGTDAGCRYPERTPVYLQNLDRLGLIAFSDEPIDDRTRYQVLEAQPHVVAAREAAGRPRTVYGSVHLTDLGVDFCRTCMPFDVAVDRPTGRFRRRGDGR